MLADIHVTYIVLVPCPGQHRVLNSLKNLYFINGALIHLLTTHKIYKFEMFFLTWDITEEYGIKQINLTL